MLQIHCVNIVEFSCGRDLFKSEQVRVKITRLMLMCQRGSKVTLRSLSFFQCVIIVKTLRLECSWCISVPLADCNLFRDAFVIVTNYCERRAKVKPALPLNALATPVKYKAFTKLRNVSCALNPSVSVRTCAHWSVYKACDRKFV